MSVSKKTLCWAVLWRGNSAITGQVRHFVGEPNGTTRTALFATRAKARTHITEKYGYIKNREDLRNPPHCWMTPLAVRVSVTIEATGVAT